MDINRAAPVRAVAETVIAAPIDLVWAVQADLERWSEWNPDVQRVDVRGDVQPGTVFKWKAGGVGITSQIRVADAPRTIGWTGRTLGLRAAHVWNFKAAQGGTHVRTEESFDGLLARLFAGPLRRMLQSSLEKGVEALRIECERRAGKRG